MATQPPDFTSAEDDERAPISQAMRVALDALEAELGLEPEPRTPVHQGPPNEAPAPPPDQPHTD